MAKRTRPCLRCKAMIPAERLEALPETRLCIQCSEKVGSDFRISVRRINTAKSGSLKKNYGGLEIVKRRRDIRPLDEEEGE